MTGLPDVAKSLSSRDTVLMYHRLHGGEKGAGGAYALSSAAFERHLRLLIDDGRQASSVKNDPGGRIRGQSRRTLITFDDGHKSDRELALPLLSAYGLPAISFVTTNWIGTSGYMSGSDLSELVRGGMSVQSHGATHAFLSQLSEADCNEELRRSKGVLEDLLGQAVSSISFPGGRFNSRVLDLARANGYTTVFTSVPFSVRNVRGLTVVGRYCLKDSVSGARLQRILGAQSGTRIFAKASYYALLCLKRSMGDSIYHSAWRALRRAETGHAAGSGPDV